MRIRIPEVKVSMLALLNGSLAELNIADLQYGENLAHDAWPVFTFTAETPEARAALEGLPAVLDAAGLAWEELAGAVDVQFRAIPRRGDLLKFPLFLRLDFYERPGALHDFLDTVIRGRASFCYFNYRQSGERIGRALIGVDVENDAARSEFADTLPARGPGYR